MPAPTKVVFDVCIDFFEFWVSIFGLFLTVLVDFRGQIFLSSVVLSYVGGVEHEMMLNEMVDQGKKATIIFENCSKGQLQIIEATVKHHSEAGLLTIHHIPHFLPLKSWSFARFC